jgi:DNA-binding MarR family transcriptional regulator
MHLDVTGSEEGGGRAVLDDLRRIVKILRTSSTEAERRVGLSGAQLFVLQALAGEGQMTVSELAMRTLTHQSSVSVVASKLVRQGLASKRKPSNGDGRFVVLSVTAKGRKLLSRAPPMAQERLVRAVQKMTPGEREALGKWLHRLVQALAGTQVVPGMLFEEGRKEGNR